MPKLFPLNVGDYVEVRDGFVAGKSGEVEEVCGDGRYKLDFGEGWCGWHERSNLKIIKRHSPINTQQPQVKIKTSTVMLLDYDAPTEQ